MERNLHEERAVSTLPSLLNGPKSENWLHCPHPVSLNCHLYTENDVCVGPSDNKGLAGDVFSAASWEDSHQGSGGHRPRRPRGPRLPPPPPVTFPAGRSNALCGGHQINFS